MAETKVFGMKHFPGITFFGDETNYASFATDGELSFVGTSRVEKTIQIPAGSAKAPGASPAVFTSLGLDGAWEFSKGSDLQISSAFAIRPDMDRSVAPSVKIGWSSPATTNDVHWKLEYLWIGANENAASVTPNETLTEITTVSPISNGYKNTEFQLLKPSSTDIACILRITRLGSLDNADDVANITGIVIKYTSNKLGEAL